MCPSVAVGDLGGGTRPDMDLGLLGMQLRINLSASFPGFLRGLQPWPITASGTGMNDDTSLIWDERRCSRCPDVIRGCSVLSYGEAESTLRKTLGITCIYCASLPPRDRQGINDGI